MRTVDLLESLPQVNVERIGCIGNGNGAQLALFTAALFTGLSQILSSLAAAHGDQVGELGDAGNVENQRDPAISHDRGTGITGDMVKVAAHGFDNNFYRIVKVVNDQSVFE